MTLPIEFLYRVAPHLKNGINAEEWIRVKVVYTTVNRSENVFETFLMTFGMDAINTMHDDLSMLHDLSRLGFSLRDVYRVMVLYAPRINRIRALEQERDKTASLIHTIHDTIREHCGYD